MRFQRLPEGWNKGRIERLIERYENQSESDAVTEDESIMEPKKNQRRALPKKTEEERRDATFTKLLTIFRELDYLEQADVLCELSQEHFDTITEMDRLDHQLIEEHRHDESAGRPWEEVKKELFLAKKRRKAR
jgi:hypothetical protein